MPLWGPTRSTSRGSSPDRQATPLSSGSSCQSLPGDGVSLTHSPGGGSQGFRHSRGAHFASSGRSSVLDRHVSLLSRLVRQPGVCLSPPLNASLLLRRAHVEL